MPSSNTGLSRVDFVAPEETGQTLIWPSADLMEVWNRNLCAVKDIRQASFENINFTQWLIDARRSMLALALKHVSRYADLESEPVFPDDWSRILMAGHQPELFHPGVWFKNFVLSRWGASLSAISINLIIDNDLADAPCIRVLQGVETEPCLVPIFFDQPGDVKPFEETWVSDSKQFKGFAERVRQNIESYVPQSLIEPLWAETRIAFDRLAAADADGRVNLGEVIAAGRHRLELNNGLRTLELPISRLADEKPFAEFVRSVLSRAGEFLELHNLGLAEYRTVHGLRSKTHPFPQLEKRDAWIEVPFWIWSTANPQRNRLFVKLNLKSLGSLQLTDFKQFERELTVANFVEELQAIRAEGIKLRPRALMTTMYSRLVLSDLFIHGIGGGKYDSLTDWIAERFFDLKLPEYCVASATFKLPLKSRPASEADMLQLQQQLRQLETHPERLLLDQNSSIPLSPEIRSMIDRKGELISQQFSGSGRERHAAIVECNQRLRQALLPLQKELTDRLAIIEQDLAANRILQSREFSFCLFGLDLIKRLQNC